MFMDIWIVSAILVATLALLVTEKLPVDMTAIGIMVALMLTRILTPAEAVAGFANPAVITVGAMFLVSRGMIRTGAVEFIGKRVVGWSGRNVKSAMLIVLLMVAVASAFINNTPVVVLFIPVVMSMCCQFGLSPSKYLIPVSYASILAGTCTLIGTSTNIIVSDLSAASGYGELGMFELAVVGVPIAVVGLVFLLVASPRLLPEIANPACELEEGRRKRYLAEITIPKGSRLVGQDPRTAFSKSHPELEVLELIRYSHVYYPSRDAVEIAPDDLLLVKGTASDLVAVAARGDVGRPLADFDGGAAADKGEEVVVELIVPPQSALLGQRIMESALAKDPELHIIAVKRSRLHFTERQVMEIKLRVGDILLIRLPAQKLDALRGNSAYIVVEDVHHELVQRQKAGRAALIFAGIILAASSGLADMMVCALTGAFLMILSGCLQVRDAYRSLQGNVLMLIAGTIALGAAMEKTGTSRVYAEAFLSTVGHLPPVFLVSSFILLTSIGTQVVSNNATAVLVLPVAVTTALEMGIDPRPMIIAVCIGASACYATPIGYQTNLLVYGPGGYRFSDYLKLGIPLNLLVLVMGSLLIPVFWPL
jgi:di/tricarboxylate transporter